MSEPVVIEDATIRPHRVEWVGDTEYPCHVWYVPDQLQPNLYTVDEGEAMGLTPPQPAPPPTIDPLTTFDPNYDYPDWTVLAHYSTPGVCRIRVEGAWTMDGVRTGVALISENWTVVHVPAATQPPSTADATVEIGGQTMTQAQFDAARYPLLNPTPPAATQPPSTADALHTLGLTADDIKAAAGDYGYLPWTEKIIAACREAVQR